MAIVTFDGAFVEWTNQIEKPWRKWSRVHGLHTTSSCEDSAVYVVIMSSLTTQSKCWGKSICSTPSLRSFSNVAFEPVPMLVWLTMAQSCPFKAVVHCCRSLCLSPPGDQWCDVHGFVPASSVSSSLTLQIFWDTSHLRWLLCLTVYRCLSDSLSAQSFP